MATDQKAVKKQLMAEGFALLSPPNGQCAYVRGTEYRDANGKECKPPKPTGPSASDITSAALSDRINAMPLADQMRMLMGDTIDHDVMVPVMENEVAGDVLADYDDAAIKAYLEGQKVAVKDSAKKPALLNLVDALHA